MAHYLVRQRLPEGGDITKDHLEPAADLVARSLEDPPRGEVIWLWGCGDIKNNVFYMLYDAPDEAAVRASSVGRLPGIEAVDRVMHATKEGLARYMFLSMSKDYEARMASEAGGAES